MKEEKSQASRAGNESCTQQPAQGFPSSPKHRQWFCDWVVLWFGGSVIWWPWFLAKLWATNLSCPALPRALSFWDTPGYLKQVNSNYRLQFQPICCSSWDLPVNSHFVSSPKPTVWNVLFCTFFTPILALRISVPRESTQCFETWG